jgi:very-short-patch-repair endonuclease
MLKKSELDKKELYNLYCVEKHSILELADFYKVSRATISLLLRKFKIPLRTRKEYRQLSFKHLEKFNKKFLSDEYKTKSTITIAKENNISQSFVASKLRFYGIKLRTLEDASLFRPKESILKGKNHPFFGKKRPGHSKKMKGKNNPLFGKHHLSKTKKKISITRIKRFQTGEIDRTLYTCKKPEWSKQMKENWKNKDFRQLMISKSIRSQKKSLNKCESLLFSVLPNNFVYSGDGSVIIDGFNPDFIDKRRKLIIEHYGDYWHNLPEWKERDKRRFVSYTNAGYKLLIIWEHDLVNINQVKEKINNFIGE